MHHDQSSSLIFSYRRDELYRETLFRAVPPKTSMVNAKIRMASCKDYKQRQIRVTNGRLKVAWGDAKTIKRLEILTPFLFAQLLDLISI